MAQSMPGDVDEQAPLEVVVPTRRRRMIGWAMLQPGETSGPSHPLDSSITQDHILPPDQKRRRPTAKEPETQHKANSDAKPKGFMPSKRPSQGSRAPKQSRIAWEGAKSGTDNPVELKREITRLKIENDLRALAESQEIQRLKAEVKRLERLKTELNRTIDRLISDPARSATAVPESATDNDALLREKERLIERQVCSIKDLESSLNEAYEHEVLRSRIRSTDLPTSAASIEDAMASIKRGVIRTADLLSSCLHPPHLLHLVLQMNAAADLRSLFNSTVKDTSILEETPDIALRAMLFRIVRDQILQSKVWTAFHTEGFMLRAYQRTIHHTAGSEFASTFHKAALLHMLDHDPDFEACFLSAQAKELQIYTINLLDPILDPAKLTLNEKDLLREMDHLFSETFFFRARCLAPDGIRYEVIHFEPGEPFDSATMEAQDATGKQIQGQEKGKKLLIKLCVHGTVVAHRVQETETDGLQKLKLLSQPFLQPSKSRARSGVTVGEVASDKAIVILG
ncbi:hypothetical protein BDW67DRAFT_164119 [Aspergillus spinulosporus]